MNKVKSILAVALVFVMSIPCFGSDITIKRKKGKWNYTVEQKAAETMTNNQEESPSIQH
jgi:hypothetical protein